MYCKNCGKKLEDDSRDICTDCEIEINNGPIKYENNTNYDTGKNEDSKKSEVYSESKPGKSKIAAGIFAIFFGSFGVHNFYLGYNGKAIAQLLITILSFGVFSFVSAIWSFIEGILILTGEINKDANGNPLKDN